MKFIKITISVILALVLCMSFISCISSENPESTNPPSLDANGSGANKNDGVTASMKSYESQMKSGGHLIPFKAVTSVLAEEHEEEVIIISTYDEFIALKQNDSNIYGLVEAITAFEVNEAFFEEKVLVLAVKSITAEKRPIATCAAYNTDSAMLELGIVGLDSAASGVVGTSSTSYCISVALHKSAVKELKGCTITPVVATSRTE